MSSLEIEVDVNESYINRVTPGQRIEATLDAYPEWRIPGKVITTVPTADRQKATVLVRIAFDRAADSPAAKPGAKADRLDPRILPDMGIKVTFLGTEQLAAAAVAAPVTIPKNCVRTDAGSQIVFVAGDGTVERRAVRLGNAKDDRLEILSGVSAGERVVVDPPGALRDGTQIVVK